MPWRKQVEIQISLKDALDRLDKTALGQVPRHQETTGKGDPLTRKGRVEAEGCLVESQTARCVHTLAECRFDEFRPEVVRVMQQGHPRESQGIERQILIGDKRGGTDGDNVLREQQIGPKACPERRACLPHRKVDPVRVKLATRSVAVRRRSMPGWARVRSARRGMSHLEAKVGVTLIVARAGARRNASVASASCAKARETAAW